MSKRFIMVLCIALLVVSVAAARVLNFSVGPAFSFYKGEMPLSEDGSIHVPYKGTGFGIDTAFDLTFGDRAELYFQDTFTFSGKVPFEDVTPSEEYDIVTLDLKSHVGFEFALLTDPIKLSFGAGVAAEFIIMTGLLKPDRDTGNYIAIINIGVGGTVKAEYQFSENWSVYAKAYVDYMFVTGATGGEIPVPEGYEPQMVVGRYNNLSIDASIGTILHF